MEDGENKNDPSWLCNFRSLFHSRPGIPSKLWSSVVGTLCIMSLGILSTHTHTHTIIALHTCNDNQVPVYFAK